MNSRNIAGSLAAVMGVCIILYARYVTNAKLESCSSIRNPQFFAIVLLNFVERTSAVVLSIHIFLELCMRLMRIAQ